MGTTVSVAVKKGTKMAARWRPARAAVRSEPFPLIRRRCPEWSGAVKGAPLLGAAKRTLDGEDRSEMIAEEGKAGRRVSERWAAILVPSPTASNTDSSANQELPRDGWVQDEVVGFVNLAHAARPTGAMISQGPSFVPEEVGKSGIQFSLTGSEKG